MQFGDRRRLREHIAGYGFLPVAVALLVLTAGVAPVAGIAPTASDPASAENEYSSQSSAAASNTITDCPETPITQSGVYEITGDITNSTAGDCIEINASDVRIEGNGHTLRGVGSGDGRPVHAVNHSQNDGKYGDANELTNVTVANLTVTDWKKPVTFRRVTHSTVRDSAILGTGEEGIHASYGHVNVVDTRISNRTTAIEFDSIGKAFVRGNTLTHNAEGIVAESPPNSTHRSPFNRIENNTIRNNTDFGIRLADDAQETMVYRNVVVDNGHSANATTNANGLTVTDSSGVRIRNNTIVRNADNGVEVLSTALWSIDVKETKLFDNEIRRNGEHGVRIVDSGDDRIVNNTVGTNGLDGIKIAYSENVEIRDNDLYRHTAAQGRSAGVAIRLVNDSADATVSNNHVHDNRNGISVESGAENASIRDNRVVTNYVAGLWVRSGVAANRLTVRGNVFGYNAKFGVRNADGNAVVNATGNYWGDPTGPSSAASASQNLSDPVTGTLADGTGDAVSEDGTSGDSNVHFDSWRAAAGSACSDVTTPGRHELRRNVTNSRARYCINVTADDVILDGMGHTIDGVGGTDLSSGPHPPVGIRVTGENVTITNVTVTDWMTGIVFRNATGFVFNSTVTNADLDGIVARDSTAEFRWNDITADDDGIQLTNSTVAVTHTNVTNGDGTDLQRGIRANSGSEVFVTETTIENAAITGILLNTFSEGQIRTTTIEDSDVGIEVSSESTGYLSDSEIRGSDGDGVRVESESAFNVTGSNLTNVGESAVVFASDARTKHAQIHGNNFAGVADYGVSNRNQSSAVNAVGNYWGDASGPASNASDADAPFADPVSGALADGSGAAVSEGSTAGVSNVIFDPHETSPHSPSGVTTTAAPTATSTTGTDTPATGTTTKALRGTTGTETRGSGQTAGTTEGDASTPGFTPATAVVALLAFALLAVRIRE